MTFTASKVDQLRVRFAEYREKYRVRPKEPLSIELVLSAMDESAHVPRTFFAGRERKALNNKLWRFVCGSRPEDEALSAIQTFLDHAEESEEDLPEDDDDERRIVHGMMANGSLEARRVFEAIRDGIYSAKPLADSEEHIDLKFACDRQNMLIDVEEIVYLKGRAGAKPGRMGTSIRKGYGFLSTGRFLLHIFLRGATARDRIHYIENGSLLSDGHPFLARMGGGQPGDQRSFPVGGLDAGTLFDIFYFRSKTLDEERRKEAAEKRPPGMAADQMRLQGPAPGVAWGVLPYGVRHGPGTAERELIEGVRHNSWMLVRRALRAKADPNYQDEEGMTSLHHAAALGARIALRLLIASGRCNYLIADHKGRYPSDLAIEWSRDFAVARLLTRKRLAQADAEGVEPRQRWR